MPLLNKQVIKKIEEELCTYPMKSQETNEWRDDIIYETSRPEISVSGGKMGNATQNKGIRLAINSGWVDLITEALVVMPMEYKRLVQFRYFKGMTNDMTAEALHISRALYYFWKENVILCICLLAIKDGLIDPMESQKIG